jgi:hypothetical protein
MKTAAAGALAVALPGRADGAQSDLQSIHKEIEKRHDENVRQLRTWIRQPSIAAEDRGMEEGCQLMIELAKEAGFEQAARVPTEGYPGVLATLDAGASRTVGLYFMYDVKQVDPGEWSSPPWEAALVDKPGLGKVMIGRGTVNQKGPQYACLAAVRAFRSAGESVNLVSSPKERKRSDHPILRRLSRTRKQRLLSRDAPGSSCHRPPRAWTGLSQSRSAQKGSSNSN